MIVTVHQPNYLPYLGFFDKMSKADIFVIYDDAQFNKDDFQHRNKIRIHQGWKWLTVPVNKKHIPIKDIRINNEHLKKSQNWAETHLQEIKQNYGKSPFYNKYKNDFEKIYEDEYYYLVDLNIDIIKLIKNAFQVDCELVLSSELGLNSKSTERLVDITETLNGDVYLSGPSGYNYLDTSLFESKSIKVKYQDFKHPLYNQQYDQFIPNMSSIDFLFNKGKFSSREEAI